MEYLIPAGLVLLTVAGFVVFTTFYATRKGGPGEVDRSAEDSGDSLPGQGTDSSTALGDTDQLSQEQTGGESGAPDETSGEKPSGGSGQDGHSGDAGSSGSGDPADPPESENLANRSF